MSWEIVAPALQTDAASVADVGNVMLGDRHIQNGKNFEALFSWPRTQDGVPIPGADTSIRGTRLVRDSIAERWRSTQFTHAEEVYTFRTLSAVMVNEAESEAIFNGLIERLWARFRDRRTIGDALVIGAAETPAITYLKYDEVPCHYAEIRIPVTWLPAIGAVTQPVGADSIFNRRDTYSNVAEQFAAYIETLSLVERGHVHRERPQPSTLAEFDEAFKVEVDTPGHPLHTTPLFWRVYRDSDEETRLPGQIIEAKSKWVLNHSRGWKDSVDSYDAVQRHLDDVRAIFRGLGNLGNTLNPTQCLSSPLQVGEVGARRLGREPVHFVDAWIEVEETVYAATA